MSRRAAARGPKVLLPARRPVAGNENSLRVTHRLFSSVPGASPRGICHGDWCVAGSFGQECGPEDPEEQEVMLSAELLSSTRRLLLLNSDLPDRQNQQNQNFRPSFARFTGVVR
jgi:hypothetical protein